MILDPHYYGQGAIDLAPIAADGTLGAFAWVGDVSAFSLKPTSDQVQHKESYSGQRGLTDDFPVGAALTIDMTLHQFSPAALARVARGAVVNTIAGTVTAESLGSPDVGAEIYLANPGVSDLVITDTTTSSPKTLVEGTDYSVDLNFGRVTILNITGLVPPFAAAYSYAARNSVGILKTGQQKYALKFRGLNLAEGNAPVIIDIYKLSMGIVQQLDMITTGNDVAGMQVTGAALIDTSKAATAALGQFGAITQVVPA